MESLEESTALAGATPTTESNESAKPVESGIEEIATRYDALFPNVPALPRMTRGEQIALGLASLLVTLLVLAKINAFGLWEPWEVAVASPTPANSAQTSPFTHMLMQMSGAILGPRALHTWGGRAAIGLTALLAALLTYGVVLRHASRRAALYALVVLGTSPLFLLNSTTLMGNAPRFFGGALLFFGAAGLLFGERSRNVELLMYLATALGLAAATASAGLLAGAVPPLAAVCLAYAANGGTVSPTTSRGIAFWLLTTIAIASAVAVGYNMNLDSEGYSWVLGGAPRGGNPPTFEVAIERLFHSFAPWSAILPLAIGRMIFNGRENALIDGDTENETSESAPNTGRAKLGSAFLLWTGLAYVAETVFASRYGLIGFLALPAIAGLCALFMEEVEGRGAAAAGVVALLLAGLLIRDFRGYPISPTEGLAIDAMTLPDTFKPIGTWAATIGLFGLCAFFGFGVQRGVVDRVTKRDFARAPFEFLASQAARGPAFALWTATLAIIVAATFFFGVLSLVLYRIGPAGFFSVGEATVAQQFLNIRVALVLLGIAAVLSIGGLAWRWRAKMWTRPIQTLTATGATLLAFAVALFIATIPTITSLAFMIGRGLLFIPFAIIAGAYGLRLVMIAFQKIDAAPLAPTLIAGAFVGAYITFGYLPKLAANFSTAEVYSAYIRHGNGEPLGEYRVGAHTPGALTTEPRTLETEAQVVEFLTQNQRNWLTFRADDLASLDRAFRTRSGEHLFVVDASGGRILLASNRAVENETNHNYLMDVLFDDAHPPTIQHPVHAILDRRIELLGYNLSFPGNASVVGPGQSMVITWIWKCIAPVSGGYKIFLHVDGHGERLNGDHDPVDPDGEGTAQSQYPLRLWEPGNIVADRQTLMVPINFPSGEYTFYIGLFQGDTRMPVNSGNKDAEGRIIAGTFTVR